jgi:hypothetical protein
MIKPDTHALDDEAREFIATPSFDNACIFPLKMEKGHS